MSYVVNGVTYHASFPPDWAMSHRPGTGPVECANCAFFGMEHGQFKGYCLNCYDYVYAPARRWFHWGLGPGDAGAAGDAGDASHAGDPMG